MKKILLLFVMLVGAASMLAQTPYCCVTKGSVLTFTDYDDAGKETGTTVNVYKDVSGSGNDYDILMETTVNVGGTTSTNEVDMQVRNGNAIINMGGGGTIDLTATDPELLSIPNQLAVGYKLPLGIMYVDLGGFRVKSTITENEVIDREEITTPAGTFKCYVVQQTSEGRVMGIKSETTTKTWYARGVGMVKMETYSKGKLFSSTVLTSMEKK